MVCTGRVVRHEPATATEQTLVLAALYRVAYVPRLGCVGSQWSRFSHCHNAIEIAKEIVISNMIVATIDG